MTAIISLSLMIAAIYVLAVVTDEFFIPSLDRISHRWNLPSNVAGASLMAVGSSAPELAIAFLSLFKEGGAHSDIGAGTIVGSAVFNILVITGVSAIFARRGFRCPPFSGIRFSIFWPLPSWCRFSGTAALRLLNVYCFWGSTHYTWRSVCRAPGAG